MKEKKSLIIKLICTFSVLLAIFVAVGFSDYVVNGGLNTSDKISENDNVIENNDMVTLSFKYAITEGEVTEYDVEDIPGMTEAEITDQTSYNKFFNDMKDMVENPPESGTDISSTGNMAIKYKGKESYDGYMILVYVLEDIKQTISGTGCDKTYYYSGKYTIKKQKCSVVSVSTQYYDNEIKEKIRFTKGQKISRQTLERKMSFLDDANYRFVGLSETKTDGGPSDTLASFPITPDSDKTYYAVFVKTNDSVAYGNALGVTISNLTSGNNVIFNAGTALEEFNLTNDASYFSGDNTVFLGDKTSTIVTADGNTVVGSKIASGVTVNFGLNSGEVTKTQELSSVLDLEPEDSAHVNQYTVCLQSDLYVYGTLVVGSNYGTTQNTNYEGHIAKEYVALDLNGHNIYLNGGTLNVYGLIKNSRDTGEIIASGGTIYTLAVVYDYRGGTATNGLVDDKIFPFQVYSLPYFRCKARLLISLKDGCTKFIALCLAQTTRISHSSIEINFLGNDTDQVLFKAAKKENSYIEIEGTENKNITDGKTEASDEVKFCLSRRLKISFINCSVRMSNIVINPGKEVDTKDYNFPVSSFFDVYLKNTEMTFSQSLKFMPGMSLIADKESKVILSYDSSSSKVAQISVLGNSAIYQCSEKGKMITNDLISVDPYSFGKTFFASQSLWKYYSGNRIKIYGTLVFQGGNKSCGDYLLAGAIDFNRVAYSADGTTSVLDYIDYSDDENPFAKLMEKHNDVSVKTYGYDYLLGDNNRNNVIKGYSRPLVSYGKGYYTNGSAEEAKVGDYSFVTGIYKVSDSEMYYFDAGTTFTLEDNSTCDLKACTYDETEHVFIDKASNEKFAYFASSYYPYTNTDGTITLNTIRANNNTAKSVTVKWDSSLGRWLRA